MKHFFSKIFLLLFPIIFILFVAPIDTEAQNTCVIRSAKFTPSGPQADGWYKDEAGETVKINVVGVDCAGQIAEVSIVEYDPGADDDIAQLDDTEVVFPSSNTFSIEMKAGETDCEQTIGSSDDCDYFIKIDLTGASNFSSDKTPGGNLRYDCDTMCDESWGAPVITRPEGPSVTPATPPVDLAYTLLSPLPCEKGTDNCPDGMLTKFDPTGDEENKLIGRYLNIMLRIFIGICAVLAVMMIVVGGLEYMTMDLVSSKEHARSRITGAILGLLLALGSWAILNEINPDLLNTDFSSLKKATAKIDLEADVPQTPVDGKYANGTPHGAPWEGTPSVLVGVNVSPTGDCQTVGQPRCTSIKGLDVSYLNKIKAGCPSCQLTVTGATEFWLHGGKSGSTSHGKGSPTIDLRVNAELTQYIAGNKKLIYFERYEKDGMSFLYEGNHWHVGR